MNPDFLVEDLGCERKVGHRGVRIGIRMYPMEASEPGMAVLEVE